VSPFPAPAAVGAGRERVEQVREAHTRSWGTYGAPRVHADLPLGLGVRCGRKRVARLMAGRSWPGSATSASGPRPGRCRHRTRTLSGAGSSLTARTGFWCTDITEHPTAQGNVYCAAVTDVWSRRIVGWSIADHIRAELVVDAVAMASWQRRPTTATVVDADRGSQYASWTFGHRPREARLFGSMGRVDRSVENGLIESFCSTMQRGLLDRRTLATRAELGSAIFEWIEGFYNPVRRHSALAYAPRPTTRPLQTRPRPPRRPDNPRGPSGEPGRAPPRLTSNA